MDNVNTFSNINIIHICTSRCLRLEKRAQERTRRAVGVATHATLRPTPTRMSIAELSGQDVMPLITERPAGTTARLTIVRGSERRTVTVTVRS